MNYFPHGRPSGPHFFNTHHSYVEHVNDTYQWIPTKPWVHHCQHYCCIRRLRELQSRFVDPSNDVHPVSKLTNWLPPYYQFQQHHAKAVHITFLVHFQSVCILCATTRNKLNHSTFQLPTHLK